MSKAETKILLVGDVFGRPGRRMVETLLPTLRKELELDLIIVNGENAAGGKGLTPEICENFFEAGADVISTGNHVRDKKVIDSELSSNDKLLRPFNYPADMPGKGYCICTAQSGVSVGVLNAIGTVHMGTHESPFSKIREEVKKIKEIADLVVVDFHAEATSEKRAMGWYLDGYVSAVLGTHTHVQTADEEVLPGGTAYITDVGMTGPHDSVIGMKKEVALDRFLKNTRGKFDVAKGDVKLCGAVFTVDNRTFKAIQIERIRINEEV